MKQGKRQVFLMAGLLAAALGVFIRCAAEEPAGDDNTTTTPISVPDAGDLPALPVGGGVTAVGGTTEATALLEGLSTVSATIRDAIFTKLQDTGGRDINQAFEITNEAILNEKILVTATNTIYAGGSDFNEGDRINEIYGLTSKSVVAEDTAEESVTIVTGSTFEEKWTLIINVTATTAGDFNTAQFNGTGANIKQYVYALTAATAAKSAKIILNATETWNASYENQTSEGAIGSTTHSGWLKVYGANNSLVYTLEINGEEDYWTAVGYFGITPPEGGEGGDGGG